MRTPSNFVLFSVCSLFLLSACGGNSNDVSAQTTSLNPPSADYFPDSLTIIEGQMAEMIYDGVYHVSIAQSEPNTATVLFFSYKYDNALRIIAPNVHQDTVVDVTVSFRDPQGNDTQEEVQLTFAKHSLNISESLDMFYSFAGGSAIYDDVYLDPAGVPLVFTQGDYQYIPTHIAAYAYSYHYDYFANGNEGSLDKFLTVAQWLKDNCVYTEYGFCTHRYAIENAYYEVYDDWPSAMAQGQAMFVLLAAGYYTQDITYIETAYDMLSAFGYFSEQKGLSSMRDGKLWYEEYASETIDSGVLNGFLFAMAGIYSFDRLYPEVDLAGKLFEQGIDVLVQQLPLYDMGFSTFYNVVQDADRENLISSAMAGSIDGYHELHVYQLAWVYAQTQHPMVYEYLLRYLAYDFGRLDVLGSRTDFDKFVAVNASREAVSGYGAERLTDKNWTYGRYWSSLEPNAQIELTVNEDVLDTDRIDSVVLVFLSEASIPETLNVYFVDEQGESSFAGTFGVLSDGEILRTVQVGDDTAVVVKTELNLPVVSNRITLQFDNADLIALREINVLYDRVELAQYLIGLYER